MAISNGPFTYRRKTGVKSEPILKNIFHFLDFLFVRHLATGFRPLFWTLSLIEFVPGERKSQNNTTLSSVRKKLSLF